MIDWFYGKYHTLIHSPSEILCYKPDYIENCCRSSFNMSFGQIKPAVVFFTPHTPHGLLAPRVAEGAIVAISQPTGGRACMLSHAPGRGATRCDRPADAATTM